MGKSWNPRSDWTWSINCFIRAYSDRSCGQSMTDQKSCLAPYALPWQESQFYISCRSLCACLITQILLRVREPISEACRNKTKSKKIMKQCHCQPIGRLQALFTTPRKWPCEILLPCKIMGQWGTLYRYKYCHIFLIVLEVNLSFASI